MKSLPDLPAITMDDDPDVFSTYLHTLYFGAEPLKERVAAMIEENSHRQQKPSDSDSGDQGANVTVMALHLLPPNPKRQGATTTESSKESLWRSSSSTYTCSQSNCAT